MSINFQFGNPEKKLLGCTIANQRKSIIFAKYRMRLGYLPSVNRLALGKSLKKTRFFPLFLSLVPRFIFGESSVARKKFEKNTLFSTFSLACTTI